MKLIFLLSSTLLSIVTFGQFAIVSDKDGYCNVRNSSESGNKISDTLMNGHLVYCFEKAGNWINIDYSRKTKELHGYLYHDRIKYISDFRNIPVFSKQTHSATYAEDSIKVTVTTQKSDKTKYRFSYYKGNKDQIELINGKRYWGTDGGQPRTEYKVISIVLGKRNILLPQEAVANLFEPNLFNTEVNYDEKNDVLYIQSMNSDGAGGYLVIWKIESARYTDRYVTYGF